MYAALWAVEVSTSNPLETRTERCEVGTFAHGCLSIGGERCTNSTGAPGHTWPRARDHTRVPRSARDSGRRPESRARNTGGELSLARISGPSTAGAGAGAEPYSAVSSINHTKQTLTSFGAASLGSNSASH